MSDFLDLPWIESTQVVLGLLGTWLLAFGLKSAAEAKAFDTMKPHPQSWRFYTGLILLTLAGLPQVLRPFLVGNSHSDRPTASAVGGEGWVLVSKGVSGEIQVARDSVLRVSPDVVSVWVRHQGTGGVKVFERYEVNCVSAQRRVLELWSGTDAMEAAPNAMIVSRWTPTEPGTPMRELVLRVCDLSATPGSS